MPLDPIDFQEVRRQRAAADYEERRQQAIKDLYSRLKRLGGVQASRDTDANSILASLGCVDETFFVEDAPQTPDSQEETRCRTYFFEKVDGPAREAIKQRNFTNFRKLFGPALYAADQDYAKETRDNYWRWLRFKCQLEVVRLKMGLYIGHAKQCGFPDSLTHQQQRNLNRLIASYRVSLDLVGLVKSWALKGALVEAVAQQLQQYLYQEFIPTPVTSYFDLPSAFYAQHEKWDNLLKGSKALLEQQAGIRESHLARSGSSLVDDAWMDFYKAVNPDSKSTGLAMESEFKELRESGLPKRGLVDELAWRADGFGKTSAMLFDCAATRYLEATNPTDKKDLLPFLEVLLQFGAKPSTRLLSRDVLEWAVLLLLLKYLSPETQLGEKARKRLVTYTKGTLDTLASRWRRALIDPDIKRCRQSEVQRITLKLHAPRQGAAFDEELKTLIVGLDGQARRGALGQSSLYGTEGLGGLIEQEARGNQLTVRKGGVAPDSAEDESGDFEKGQLDGTSELPVQQALLGLLL